MVSAMTQVKIDHLKTEGRNPKTLQLDTMSIMELLQIMNEEDRKIIETVREALPEIEQCIKYVIEALNKGGRLIYMGAGTSGRLGIMDAVECVPTFATNDEVIGMIAGGDMAFVKAVEGAEDSKELAAADLDNLKIGKNDVVVAITASGRTPYALGALEHARKHQARCVGIACNKHSEIAKISDVAIEVDAGPEVLTGSTRLKAGTCQKIILNMISTAAMVGIGKVYGNLMVDMKPTNLKLVERAKRIIMNSTGCDYETAAATLEKAGQSIKVAIIMILTGISKEEAQERIVLNRGFVGNCL
jgi:N-acetylmuramic acid 6-phosphate etherase